MAYLFDKATKIDTVAMLKRLNSLDGDFYQCLDFSNSSTQGAVAYHKDYRLVLFRESDQRSDWVHNINMYSYEGYHMGFRRASMHAWENLDRLLGSDPRPVILGGFSLGGAIATVLAPKLESTGRAVNGVYTFGSPKVVHRSYAPLYDRQFKSRFFRFQNSQDLFTYLPFGLGYRHVGKGLVFNPQDKKIQNMDRDPQEFTNLRKVDHKILVNHSMEMYISAIENQK
jgi:predicted lipase